MMETKMETRYSDSGILFKNDQRAGERDPDHKGTIDAECEKCGHCMHRRLAAWIKTARNGSKFLSLSFRPRADQHADAQRSNG
jgi:hypothetical protein